MENGRVHPAITGTDQVGFFQLDVERPFHRLLQLAFKAGILPHHAVQRAFEFLGELTRRRPVFNRYDRLVVNVEQQVVGKAGVARHLLSNGQIARAGYVAEKVGLSGRAGREHDRSLITQPAEDLCQCVLYSICHLGEALAGDLLNAGLLQVVQLFKELFEPERPFKRAKEFFNLRLAALLGTEFAAEQ